MLSTQSMSSLMRLYADGDPQLAFIADCIIDALNVQSATHVGNLDVEASEKDLHVHVDPGDKPNLQFDLATVLRVTNRWNFMRIGDQGAQGGFTGIMRGPFNYVPNRDGDLVIYAPNGGIDAKNFYKDGTEILPPQEGEGCDDPGTVVMMLVSGVPTCVSVEECPA